MKKFALVLATLFGLLGFLPAAAQSQAGLIFTAEPSMIVGSLAEETITIQNSGAEELGVGSLKVVFPFSLVLQSATPGQAAYIDSEATWNIPSIAPGGSFEMRFVVSPISAGQGLTTNASYSVGENVVVSTSAQTNVVATVLGEQAGSPTAGSSDGLPRTGFELGYLVFLFPAAFFGIKLFDPGSTPRRTAR